MVRPSTAFAVETKNRYVPLSDEVDSDMDCEDLSDTGNDLQTKKESGKAKFPKSPSRKQRPPPIIIHGEVKSHKELINKMENIITNKFYIRYQNNRTAVHTKSQEDYEKLKRILHQEAVQFHTFTPKDKKNQSIRYKRTSQRN